MVGPIEQPRDIQLPLIVQGVKFAVGGPRHAARALRQKPRPQSVQSRTPPQCFLEIDDQLAAVLVANNSGHSHYLIPANT